MKSSRRAIIDVAQSSIVIISFAMLCCYWIAYANTLPYWTDEIITLDLVRTRSFFDTLSAIYLGVDATPPLYGGFGWILFRALSDETVGEALRLVNLLLIMVSVGLIYRSARLFLGNLESTLLVGLFVFFEAEQLRVLVVEVRAYGLFVCLVAASTYLVLALSRRQSYVLYILLCLSFLFLVSTHLFGIVYVFCVTVAASGVSFFYGKRDCATRYIISAIPALIAFIAWLPVIYNQSKLGSWRDPPILDELIQATAGNYIASGVLATLLLFASMGAIVNRRFYTSVRYSGLLTYTGAIVLALVVVLLASTSFVWAFSRTVYPVFLTRYFLPNILFHSVWIGILASLMKNTLPMRVRAPAMVACGLGAIFFAAFVTSSFANRVPCTDPTPSRFVEDGYLPAGVPIVTPGIPTWMSRLHRGRNPVVYPLDVEILEIQSLHIKIKRGQYNQNWITTYDLWRGANAVRTTEWIAMNMKRVLVLDDGYWPWLDYLATTRQISTRLLFDLPGCKLAEVTFVAP
jgi:hypothetical protein